MSVPDDSLLDEDLGDEVYDLGNEEEEALLAEDCDFEKKSCSKGEEETEDILDLGVTDVLDDLDEQEEKCGPKEYNLNFSNAKKNITSTQIIELENIEKNKTYSGFCSNLESSLDLREKLRKKSINLNYPLTKRKLKSNKDVCNEAKERNRFQNERPPKTMYIDSSYSNSPDVNKTIEKVKPSFRKHYKSKLVTSFNKKIPVEQLTGRFLSPRGIINNNFLFRPHTFENQTKFYSSDYLFTQNVNCNVYNQEARQSPYRNMLHKVSLAVQSQSSNARLIQSSCSQIKSQESHILNSDGTNIKLDSFNVPINSSSLICENLSNQSILKNNQFFPGGPCFQVPHKQESLLQCSLNHLTLIHNQSFSTVPHATAKDSNVNFAEAEHNERLLIRPNMNNLLHPHTTLAQKALPLNYKTPSYNLEGVSLNSQANNLHSFENIFTFNNELEYSSHQKEKQASNRIQCNSGSTEIFHTNNPINNDPNVFIDRTDKEIESVKIHSLPTGHKILINPHFKGNKTDSEGNISKDVVTAGKKKLNKLNQNLTSDTTSKHDDPFSYFSDVWQENKQPKINQSSRVSSSELFDFYKNSPYSSTSAHRDVKKIKKVYKKNEMKENPVKTFEIKNKTRKTEEIEKTIDTSTLSNTNISPKKKSDNVDIGAKIFNKKNSSCQIFIPTKKRAIPASDNSEIDKRLRLERRNLSRKLSPQNLSPEKIEQIDTEMKIYQKRLEEQKKLREKVLREKENRRKLAALTKHL